jgi:hypothetical protein
MGCTRRRDAASCGNEECRDGCQASTLRCGKVKTREITRRLRGGEIARQTGGRDGSGATQRRRRAARKGGHGIGRQVTYAANVRQMWACLETAAPATRRQRGRNTGENGDKSEGNRGFGQTEGGFRGVFRLFSKTHYNWKCQRWERMMCSRIEFMLIIRFLTPNVILLLTFLH